MKTHLLFFAFAIAAVVVVSGCVSPLTGDDAEDAKRRCIEECRLEKSKETYLESGPCLSDVNPRWNVRDWVCDVAHSPRQDVDNDPKNQCIDYKIGEAHHFVEVDPDCGFIRAV
jgi:hypothetical protein